jgi:hypothetical protein
VLPFTNAVEEGVLCTIIMPSTKEEIPSIWVPGIDIQNIDALQTVDSNIEDSKFLTANNGDGNFAPGGLTCYINDKEVPYFILQSPHRGITGKLLTQCLMYMNELELFPKEEGLSPFLLLAQLMI